MLREGFTVGDRKFRALPADLAITLSSFGLGWFVGEALPPAPPAEDLDEDSPEVLAYNREILNALNTVAWVLHAPPEEVVNLAIDIDESTAKTRKALERDLKVKVRLFVNSLNLEEQEGLITAMNRLFEEMQAADYDLAEKDDAPEGDKPPGNSSSRGE